MTDPLVTCAFALHSRPGAYAILLGSGVSTGAGIPTGWQIVEDLIRRIAKIGNEDAGPDPAAWYAERFGDRPTYSKLMAQLAPAPADRHALIASYLAPDPEADQRVPTAAHRALAQLVASGVVRVIVTTNFDPLLEMALAELGVTITVLASPDTVKGALPLAHSGPVLVKVNGDHLDPRIRNTEAELDTFDPVVDRLLDQIFDEYGLVVCGWSAEHDTALCKALERCASRRFTTFWTTRGDALTGTAKALSDARQAEVIPIKDADEFFGRLADAVASLESTDRVHPLSLAVAAATVKRALEGERTAIPVHDMIRTEVERLRSLDLLAAPDYSGQASDHLQRLDRLESELELIVTLVGTAAYWGTATTDRWWMQDIERFGQPTGASGLTALVELPRVPAVAMLWAGGVAAIASNRGDLLSGLFNVPPIARGFGRDKLLAPLVLLPDLLQVEDAQWRVYQLLRPCFVEHLALGRAAYAEAIERWQYIVALAETDASLVDGVLAWYMPRLRVEGWRPGYQLLAETWLRRQDVVQDALFAAGVFGGESERLGNAMNRFREVYASYAENADWSAHSHSGVRVVPSGVHYPGQYSDDPEPPDVRW